MKPSPFDRRSQCIEGKALVRSTLCRHKLGGRPMVAPTVYINFSLPKNAVAAKANTPLLIERDKFVQWGGSLRAQALKFSFFGFLFFRKRKGRKLRPKGKTACLRARAKEGYSESGCTQGFALPKIVIAAGATDGRPYDLNDFYLNPTCYHGSPASRARGNISSQMKFATLRGAMCYFAERCVTSRSDVLHSPLARSPFPSIHCDLRSSGEGFITHQNFMSTYHG